MARDFHDHAPVHTGFAHVGVEGVPEIMKTLGRVFHRPGGCTPLKCVWRDQNIYQDDGCKKILIAMDKTTHNFTKRYYRLDEVAKYFAISRRTVYRLLDEGILKGTKIRKCMRVSVEEVRKLEEEIEKMADL